MFSSRVTPVFFFSEDGRYDTPLSFFPELLDQILLKFFPLISFNSPPPPWDQPSKKERDFFQNAS